ncbi:MAG: hypothetical protein H7Z13_07195 [Ferruginibacter sp.]|nr:hypothetical protein [Ferruginibacter sp.]
MPLETINSTVQTSARPLFLTVLCVITFIGSIAGIIINSKGYINANAEVEKISSGKAKTQLKNLFSAGNTAIDEPVRIGHLNVENYKKYSIGCIASYILCLVGTILIFKLKRTGFYSFTLGTFFNLLTHFLLFGDHFGAMGISIVAAIAGFLFVILYGMNLKYMEEVEEEEDV